MSIKWMLKALETKVGNPTRKLVLIKLCDNANDSGECWPSHQYIADHCETTRRSVLQHIKKLVEDGFIRSTQRKGPKGNSTNVYQMVFAPSAIIAQAINAGYAEIAPTPSEEIAQLDNTTPLSCENISPPSAEITPTPSEIFAHRTCHSLEPVIKEGSPITDIAPPNLFSVNTISNNLFYMRETWQPTEQFNKTCKFRGIRLNTFLPDEQEDLINEFRAYWMTKSVQFNQSGWEHKLINSLKRSKENKNAPANINSLQSKRAAVSASIMDIKDTSW